jgi:uncharacterized Zn finger protein
MTINLQCLTCGSEQLELVKMLTDDRQTVRTVRCVHGHESTFTQPRPRDGCPEGSPDDED